MYENEHLPKWKLFDSRLSEENFIEIGGMITQLFCRRIILPIEVFAFSTKIELITFYHAIEKLTVLDRTCGSGAFLFAALNILEPLYEACLDRMEAFLAENANTNGRQSADPFNDPYRTSFRKILARVAEHSNRCYFILKAIIVNNLFGVDIVEEAVEICKLRLFLKLAAQAEKDDSKPNLGIEPLPDIDFNIRAGNTLVGFATRQEVKDWITLELKTGQYKMRQLLSGDALERIEVKAQAVDDLFASFRQQQTEDNTNATPVEKENLQKKLDELRDELNRYLAAEYGISQDQSSAYSKWLKSHKPFHWFVEFYSVMKSGGFDVIIGNPPYVEYSKIRQYYTVRNYQTEPCGNLFPMVVERALHSLANDARFGMILQHSAFCTPRMQKLIEIVKQNSSLAHTSFYECRPGKLFDGIDVRLAISLLKKGHEHFRYYAGRYFRFFTEERPHLFQIVGYVEATRVIQSYSLLKVQTESEVSIADKMFLRSNSRLSELTVPKGRPGVFYSYGFRYWAKALNFRPYFEGENAKFSTGDKQLFLKLGHDPNVIVCLMNSSLFYWYYSIYSDGHNFTKTVINDFPFEYPNTGIQRKLTHRFVKR